MYKKTFFLSESLKSFYLIIIEMFYNIVYLLGFIAFFDLLFKFLNENEKYSLFKYEDFINSLFILTILMFIINFLLGIFYILYRFLKNKKILKR